MLNSSAPQMSKWRERLWPVYPEEMKIFLPMIVIMFCVLFNYTVARNIKDSLLINSTGSSSAVLPWVKLGLVTPCSIFAVIGYAKLSNILSKQKLYFVTLLPFAVYFLMFGFVLYPMHAYLNLSVNWIKGCQASYPLLKDLFPAVAYWNYSLFYMMAELWGNMGIALLFWQFANQITPTVQAKRFYPVYGFWSNLGLVAAGSLTAFSEEFLKPERLASGEKDFGPQLRLYCGCMVVACIAIATAYWWLNTSVLTEAQKGFDAKGKKSKPKLSLKESAVYLMKSRYLMYIAILMLAYGITINIVEVTWKESASQYFIDAATGLRDKNAYNAFMGKMFIGTGITTMFFILVGKNFVRSLGWRFSANITPWVTMITGVGFFLFVVFKDYLGGVCEMLGTSTLTMAVGLGLAQNVLTKGVKYALFDPTKEMAYIPLDEEAKVKGKAAIDVIGGRAGKSGGSTIQLALNAFTSGIGVPQLSVPILGGVLVAITCWWIWAVNKLAVAYAKKLAETEHIKEI
jgi:AAA family ATP:ADP antiporter